MIKLIIEIEENGQLSLDKKENFDYNFKTTGIDITIQELNEVKRLKEKIFKS